MEETKEVTEQKVENKGILSGQIIQIVFLVLLLIAVGSLIFCGIKIVQYHEMLSNPLGYNLQQFGIDSCTCYKGDSQMIINALNYSTNK